MKKPEYRILKCSNWNVVIDHNKNASINILARGLRVGLVGFTNKVMASHNHWRVGLMVETLVDVDWLQFSFKKCNGS